MCVCARARHARARAAPPLLLLLLLALLPSAPLFHCHFEQLFSNIDSLERLPSCIILTKRLISPVTEFGVSCAGGDGNPDAKRLYDDLLSNYNKLVRPVLNVSDALAVRIKLKLSQLIDVR
ncbi:unnamed protein product [Leptidea sinapis]|uniref:Neurotransmitter-gated ion-channel ligand-binding domain-containing protein n=1 Tax=Leptidea sinapis TaxID=189913 RepID=A0A5E4R8F3_9NEOP|nr:unnamed protein product [Leptidea sinapis]